MFKIFSTDSLKELEGLVSEQAKKQQELMMALQEAGAEAEAAADKGKIELENNFKMQMQGMELKHKDAALRLEQ
jgi:hypothetical protein